MLKKNIISIYSYYCKISNNEKIYKESGTATTKFPGYSYKNTVFHFTVRIILQCTSAYWYTSIKFIHYHPHTYIMHALHTIYMSFIHILCIPFIHTLWIPCNLTSCIMPHIASDNDAKIGSFPKFNDDVPKSVRSSIALHSVALLLFDDDKIKMARKPEKM